MVGARGFEPPASRSRTVRATRLRHAPICLFYNKSTIRSIPAPGRIFFPPVPAQTIIEYMEIIFTSASEEIFSRREKRRRKAATTSPGHRSG